MNDAPAFATATAEREVSEEAGEGDEVGAPVTATDVDGDRLRYDLAGPGGFEVDGETGQIRVAPGAVLSPGELEVTVRARDPSFEEAAIAVTITVTAGPAPPGIPGGGFAGGGGGGGGGGSSGPTPSEADFEWTVERDIDALDPVHDTPSGMWSDGARVWLLQNGSGAADAVFAYDLDTGERAPGREFELDETNRAPRGVWSDGESIVWVSDSGQDRLFAHDLGTGARLPGRDIELDRGNRDARGIWSDGATMWVLNRNPSLFGYDLGAGELLAEYELDPANSSPHGIWSDGTTLWVSNHDPKRLFAYRLPAPPEDGPPEDPVALERVRDEEFTELSRAGNNSPRGHLVRRGGDVRRRRARRPGLQLQHARRHGTPASPR